MPWTTADLNAYKARELGRAWKAAGGPARHPLDLPPWQGPEADLHDFTEEQLRKRGLFYIHSRMDRKTTCRKGVPDFIVAMPVARTLWLELKTGRKKLEPDQAGAAAHLCRLGHRYVVARSEGEVLAALDGGL